MTSAQNREKLTHLLSVLTHHKFRKIRSILSEEPLIRTGQPSPPTVDVVYRHPLTVGLDIEDTLIKNLFQTMIQKS